jgi:hypothetical protein
VGVTTCGGRGGAARHTAALKSTPWEESKWASDAIAQIDDDWLLPRQTNHGDKRLNKVQRRGLRRIIDGMSHHDQTSLWYLPNIVHFNLTSLFLLHGVVNSSAHVASNGEWWHWKDPKGGDCVLRNYLGFSVVYPNKATKEPVTAKYFNWALPEHCRYIDPIGGKTCDELLSVCVYMSSLTNFEPTDSHEIS